MECLHNRSWYSSNPDTSPVLKNSPKCISFSLQESIYIKHWVSGDTLSPTPSPSSAVPVPVPVSWFFCIPGRNLRNSTKHTREYLCPWTSSWRRYPNGILLWLVVQPKCRSSTNNCMSELRSVQVLFHQKYLIIWHLSNSTHAGLKAFYCTQCSTLLLFITSNLE